MRKYHKIQSVYKRDPGNNYKTFLEGEWALPVFEYLQDAVWVATEKVDGTNIRVMVVPPEERGEDHRIEFRGRTDDSHIPPRLLRKLEDTFLPNKAMLVGRFPDGGCLYGEGYGAKIQRGGENYRPDQGFVLFDVRVGPWWLGMEDVRDIALALDVEVVPVVSRGSLRDLVELARGGVTSRWGDFQAEGIVARPVVDLYTRDGERVITKIKTRDFAR